jgi:hypothetical protein
VANLWHTLACQLALVGVILLAALRRRDIGALGGLAFVAYWMLLHLPFFGDDRFMLPALPFLSLYAGYALSTLVVRQGAVDLTLAAESRQVEPRGRRA